MGLQAIFRMLRNEYAIDFEIRLYRNAANRTPHVENFWHASG